MMHDLCENMRSSDFLSGSGAFGRSHCKDLPVLLAVVSDDLNQRSSGTLAVFAACELLGTHHKHCILIHMTSLAMSEYLHMQGPSALDPRSGSIFFGGRSISSIYRRSRIDIAGPQIDEISSIYRRYIVDISTIYIVDILNVTFLFIS